jgi:hypothetical protein
MSKFLRNAVMKNFASDSEVFLPFQGWDKLIIALHEKLIVLDNNYLIKKIDISNGMLVFEFKTDCEFDASVEAMHRYVQMAIIDSSKTCTMCSKPGFLNVKNGQLAPRCKNCR